MNRVSIVYSIILALICFSCNQRELGDDYYYLPKYEAIDIGYPEGEAIVYKSNQEYSFSDVKIRGDVLEVEADSKFIIAKRDPLISNAINTGVVEYYVILKETDSIIGPLTIAKFEETISNLCINLKIE